MRKGGKKENLLEFLSPGETDCPFRKPFLPLPVSAATCFSRFLDSSELKSSQQLLFMPELESVFLACNQIPLTDFEKKTTQGS